MVMQPKATGEHLGKKCNRNHDKVQKRNTVDEGIQDTLTGCPENFWIFLLSEASNVLN
jgi:hypothetical protein